MGSKTDSIRIAYEEEWRLLARILESRGFSPGRASDCARLFAETDLDGVHSHGIARFPRFLEYIDAGYVVPGASPVPVYASGCVERHDGRLGPGNLNARDSMSRAMELARAQGVGCVGLANTNHWMRGGAFGWQAAEAGFIGICWTNTMPNLPPWGARECFLGNNPLVIGIPGDGEAHIVLDMAMSQFSYGKMEAARKEGRRLPVAGGFDAAGALTDDPGAILDARRPVAVGYWKGSGLSLMLDLMGMLIAGGDGVSGVGRRPSEFGLTQVFIAFDISGLPDAERLHEEVLSLVRELARLEPTEKARPVDYPGARSLRTRAEYRASGIPLDRTIWESLGRIPC